MRNPLTPHLCYNCAHLRTAVFAVSGDEDFVVERVERIVALDAFEVMPVQHVQHVQHFGRRVTWKNASEISFSSSFLNRMKVID